jgi:hypothetical protein
VDDNQRSSVTDEMEKNFDVFLANHQDEESALMEICDLFPELMEPLVLPVVPPNVAKPSVKAKKTANKSKLKSKRDHTPSSKDSEAKRRSSLELVSKA